MLYLFERLISAFLFGINSISTNTENIIFLDLDGDYMSALTFFFLITNLSMFCVYKFIYSINLIFKKQLL